MYSLSSKSVPFHHYCAFITIGYEPVFPFWAAIYPESFLRPVQTSLPSQSLSVPSESRSLLYPAAGRNVSRLNISGVFHIDNVFTHSWGPRALRRATCLTVKKQDFRKSRAFHGASRERKSAAARVCFIWHICTQRQLDKNKSSACVFTQTNTLEEVKVICTPINELAWFKCHISRKIWICTHICTTLCDAKSFFFISLRFESSRR